MPGSQVTVIITGWLQMSWFCLLVDGLDVYKVDHSLMEVYQEDLQLYLSNWVSGLSVIIVAIPSSLN